MCRTCSDPQFKLEYTPLEAALRWCGLFAMEAEILQAQWLCVEQLFVLFPRWHCLGKHVAMILDAIEHREILCRTQDVVLDEHRGFNPAAIRIRHQDLKRWMEINHPKQKPAFLFGCDAEENSNVRFGVYIAMKSERDLLVTECRKLREHAVAIDNELQELKAPLPLQTSTKDQQEPDTKLLMGAILTVVVGTKSVAKGQPCFATQDALANAIQARYPGQKKLSKRTINQRFSEANKRLRDES